MANDDDPPRVGRSWIAPLVHPLMRHWLIPVRNVSVDVRACERRRSGLCSTLLLHDLARPEDRSLLAHPWMGHPAATSLEGFPFGGMRLSSEPFAPARCTAYVRGVHALFSAQGTRNNYYVGNAGHLIINVWATTRNARVQAHARSLVHSPHPHSNGVPAHTHTLAHAPCGRRV